MAGFRRDGHVYVLMLLAAMLADERKFTDSPLHVTLSKLKIMGFPNHNQQCAQ